MDEQERRAINGEDVAVMKGMRDRGDRQMDIATWFGVNQGRVNELLRGTRAGRAYKHVPPAPPERLPPRGPYVVVSRAVHDEATVKAALLDRFMRDLQTWLSSYSGGTDRVNSSR